MIQMTNDEWDAFGRENWPLLARLGWDSYLHFGRGAIVIPGDDEARKLLTFEYVTTAGHEKLDGAIAFYPPERGVIVIRVGGVTRTATGLHWEESEARAFELDPPPPVVWQTAIAPAGFD